MSEVKRIVLGSRLSKNEMETHLITTTYDGRWKMDSTIKKRLQQST